MSHKDARFYLLAAVGILLAGLFLMACNRPPPTESPAAIPPEGATAVPAEGAAATPTMGPAPVPATQVAVPQIPARVRRVFDTVWAGREGIDRSALNRLEDDAWHYLSKGGGVTTDSSGEGWLKINDCWDIYVFEDSELIKSPCPRSDLEAADVTCNRSGTSVWKELCASEIIIQTLSAQIEPGGTWFSVTYLPELQLTLTLVFEGQVKAQPVLDADAYTLGEPVEVPAGHFWFTTPGIAADPIAGLSAREPHPFDELLPLVEALDLWDRIGRITSRADVDRIGYPAVPPFVPGPPTATPTPTPTLTPTPTDTPVPTSTSVPTSTPTLTPTPTDTPTPPPPPTPTPTATAAPPPTSTPTDTSTPSPIDLRIATVDSADPVATNQTYSYRIQIRNEGGSEAHDVTVSDTLPAEVTFLSIEGCSNADTGRVPIICELDTIGPNEEKHITINVQAPSQAGTVTNTASVGFRAAEAVTSITEVSDSEDTQVGGEPTGPADLAIHKTASADPVRAGDPFSYMITVTNLGPFGAQDVRVSDILPNYVTSASAAGCDNDPAGLPICRLGTIAAGDSRSFTISVIASCAETPTTDKNVANVTSSTFDPVLENNITQVDTQFIPRADLEIDKMASANRVPPNEAYSYRVTVTNNGPCDAQQVTVSDTLPAGVTFLSTVGCNNDLSGGVPTCELGAIPANDFRAFDINVTAPPEPDTMTNVVTVTSSTEDPRPDNDTDSATVTVPDGDECPRPCRRTDECNPLLNTALWIAQIILAVVFSIAGILKLLRGMEESPLRGLWALGAWGMMDRQWPIGVLEILAAGGLILPALTCKLHWLTPVAASGLAVLMIGDIVRRGGARPPETRPPITRPPITRPPITRPQKQDDQKQDDQKRDDPKQHDPKQHDPNRDHPKDEPQAW
jgi:uncharacterized repeat protein (TIGR01451 family)